MKQKLIQKHGVKKQINITGGNDRKICSFDVNEETSRHEPWTASADLYKQNIDMFLFGGENTFSNGVTYNYSKKYGRGFADKYKDTKFIEDLGEYTYNATNDSTIKAKKKRVIIYTIDESK